MSDARELALENKMMRLEAKLEKYESSASPTCSTPTEEQVLKAVYESGLHQYAPDVLKTRWKDGIDIETPSAALMNFARKLLA